MDNSDYYIILCYLLLIVLFSALILYFIYRIRSLRETSAGSNQTRSLTDGYTLRQMNPAGAVERKRVLSETPFERDEYDELIARMEILFENEKLFLQPEVRVTAVAEMLNTSKTNLSRAIKMKTGKNFCQLVHYYRVREAMRLYASNQKLSISQLYKSVGFNSKTTFNTAFGRNTGCTPAEWCKNFRKSSEAAGSGNGKKKTKV